MQKSVSRLAEIIHIISAFWVLVIALIILIDVIGRQFFNTPFLGAIEIIKNSVVSITFLQLPLAIYSGDMLRTTLLYGSVGPNAKKALRAVAGILGFLFFAGVAYSSWSPFVEAYSINEYEGEGALRVPTYPVRLLVVLTSVFAGFMYLYLMVLDWTGRLDEEGEHKILQSPSEG
ncbi:MAG: TRAP transporter small permease [Hyphomonadaceae bacterium]